MARRKTFHRWTMAELNFMRTMYRVLTRKEIAKELGVTEPAVRDMMVKYGIQKPERLKHRRWTKEDLEFIESNYQTTPACVLAEQMGSTEANIWAVVSRRGLRGKRKHTTNNHYEESKQETTA